MSWVKDRLIELGFADVAALLDRSQVSRERNAASKAKRAAAERKRRSRAKQKKEQQS